MSITERLSHEIKSAMLAKNADRLSTLRLLKSAIGYAQIEFKKDTLSDAEAIPLVQKEVKKRLDAADQFEKGGRPELAARERAECLVLQEFLPARLSDEELTAMVETAIKDLNATSKKDMGLVMRAVQSKALGRADGKSISAVVGKLLP